MLSGKNLQITLALLGMAALLLVANSAGAQWRITIGAPPYPNAQDWDSNGRLTEPGFIHGYGYYEDYSHWAPSIVITNQHRYLLPAGQPEVPVIPDGAALLRLHVPADAEIWFSGHQTEQRGAERWFVTPPLAPGRESAYEVTVHWRQEGREVRRTRRVTVHPGDRRTLNFLAPGAESVDNAETLPPPRKLDGKP